MNSLTMAGAPSRVGRRSHSNWIVKESPANHTPPLRSVRGGRIIVLAEGMASLFLESPQSHRLTLDKDNAGMDLYWAKDSRIFMRCSRGLCCSATGSDANPGRTPLPNPP